MISDNGIGIPKRNLKNLFNPFFSSKQASGGTGLGLYICNEFIKAHGGAIQVESTLNKGTSVKIQLPFKAV